MRLTSELNLYFFFSLVAYASDSFSLGSKGFNDSAALDFHTLMLVSSLPVTMYLASIEYKIAFTYCMRLV